MSREFLAIAAAIGIAWFVLRPRQAAAQQIAPGTGLAGASGPGGGQPSQPAAGAAGADWGAQVGGLLAGIGKGLGGVLSSKGGTDAQSTGSGKGLGMSTAGGSSNYYWGSGGTWSANFDTKVDKVSTLDSSTTDMDIGAGWEDADWNASSNSYEVPKYEDKMDLGDYDLGSAPQSWDDL